MEAHFLGYEAIRQTLVLSARVRAAYNPALTIEGIFHTSFTRTPKGTNKSILPATCIQDTNDTGFYHNKEFKKTAERFGLIVEKSAKYGFCITRPSPELIEFVKENVRAESFDLARPKEDPNGTKKPKGRTQSLRKYKCPACGLIIRASKDVAGKIMCVDCGEVFIES